MLYIATFKGPGRPSRLLARGRRVLTVCAAPFYTGGHGIDLGVAFPGIQALKQEEHIFPGTSNVHFAPGRPEYFVGFVVQFFY